MLCVRERVCVCVCARVWVVVEGRPERLELSGIVDCKLVRKMEKEADNPRDYSRHKRKRKGQWRKMLTTPETTPAMGSHSVKGNPKGTS